MSSIRYLLLEDDSRLPLAIINDDILPATDYLQDVTQSSYLIGKNILFDFDENDDPTGQDIIRKYVLKNGNYIYKRSYRNAFYPDFRNISLRFYNADDTSIYVATTTPVSNEVYICINNIDDKIYVTFIGRFANDRGEGIEGTRVLTYIDDPDWFLEWVGDSYETEEETGDDPFDQGGDSGTGGGDGNFDDSSEEVEVPELPEEWTATSGFLTIFKPTKAQIQNLASYMWETFSPDSWKKLFANPMDAIIGLSSYPFDIPTSGYKEIKVGGIGTGVASNTAGNQYISINCGTVPIGKYWGAYLDYSPYSKIEIYLPFIGIRELSMDDVQNSNLGVIYHIDIVSGSCVAFVTSNGNIMYQFTGVCGEQIPVTSADHNNLINTGISIAGSVIGGIASGGIGGAVVGGAMSTSVANAVSNSKPHIARAGSISGNVSMMSKLKPYVIITRPNQCKAGGQNAFSGYPIYATYKLANLKGYTEVDSIHLERVPATDSERGEIETLLQGGVIL